MDGGSFAGRTRSRGNKGVDLIHRALPMVLRHPWPLALTSMRASHESVSIESGNDSTTAASPLGHHAWATSPDGRRRYPWHHP